MCLGWDEVASSIFVNEFSLDFLRDVLGGIKFIRDNVNLVCNSIVVLVF